MLKRFAVIFSVAVAGSAIAQTVTNPLAQDPEIAKEGKRLYTKAGCMACHGNNARGAVGPDLTDDVWLRQPTDEMIFNTIKKGRSGTAMSGFGNELSDEQIWTLITWLRDENQKRKSAQ